MKIWVYSKQTYATELLVANCSKKDAEYLVPRYQATFGPTFVVWSGLKRDNPVNRRFDETAHYKCEA